MNVDMFQAFQRFSQQTANGNGVLSGRREPSLARPADHLVCADQSSHSGHTCHSAGKTGWEATLRSKLGRVAAHDH